MKKLKMFFLLTLATFSILSLNSCAVLDAPKAKLFFFAGQSNLGWHIKSKDLKKRLPHVLKWLNSEENDVLYFWWQKSVIEKNPKKRGYGSKGWIKLSGIHASKNLSIEHIALYYIWKYYKSKSSSQKILALKVQDWNTSMYKNWNTGGRIKENENAYFNAGNMYITATNKISEALLSLKKKGIKWETESFFWYQGEADSHHNGKTYKTLFKDLLYGRDMPEESKRGHAKGLLEILGNTNAYVILAKISSKLHTKSDKWGDKGPSFWRPHAEMVRNALSETAKEHPNGRVVDVDHLPMKDDYHYDANEYISIALLFAKEYLLMQEDSRAIIQEIDKALSE